MSIYASNNSINLKKVDGSSFVGRYSTEGYWNGVDQSSNTSNYVGAIHKSGAINYVLDNGSTPHGLYHPNGSFYVSDTGKLNGGLSVTIISSGFNPASLPGALLGFDASNAASLTLSGSQIASIADLSGNSNTATQSTGSKRPTLQTAAQNGLNTMRFTGSSQQVLNLTNSISSSQQITLYTVLRRGGPSGSNFLDVLGNSTTSKPWFEFWSNGIWYIYFNNVSLNSPTTPSTAYNQFSITVDTMVNLYMNGSLYGSSGGADPSSYGPINQIGYGDGLYSNGEIAELWLFSGVHSSDNRLLMEEYLKTKWGTP